MEIIAKKVSMMELFYDLIYVFAVGKITEMIHHPHNGVIDMITYIKFCAGCIIILTLWFQQTIYINKYGSNRWYDVTGMFLHMFGAIYMTNHISIDWSSNFFDFNIAVIFMLVILIIQYYLKSREYKKVPLGITNHIKLLSVALVVIIVSIISGEKIGVFISPINFIIMMFLPSIFNNNKNVEMDINFPHLVERMSLITIIIFGEMVISLAGAFRNNGFGIIPLMMFAGMILSFGTYVLQIEKVVNHYQKTRGFIMIYAHIGIFIGLSTLTACIAMKDNTEINEIFLKLFNWLGITIFYLSLLLTTVYNKDKYKIKIKDVIMCISIYIMGFLISLIKIEDSNLTFYLGLLFTILLIFSYMYKYVDKCDKSLLKLGKKEND